ncbi:D-alanyl-D-alanine carboxypeptidase/D-alanyl-D-alanine-endopeptidase [Sphingobacterium oryzagri]|uniref:D-alanyl-D-alanine carboxypeptidase/D-alanyl-D-alanine-endopeptidase n=1 Tax=Sphingobacterium oryzagri TaxID=3025669 RepID=A0ABY7WFB2_9SPHI|nr:D-alanyl-D-alanine carboxypeptidase/D-alanyl-D-alanine-endopeptidase [Sphingobacterium sp. KACC 22765]WDF68207.1 D-alanyl-D-alanine carboxypeptidase/D-alanyl-D-alanine-endopeptidase [Sphingobacterium sp. KACC 22765]
MKTRLLTIIYLTTVLFGTTILQAQTEKDKIGDAYQQFVSSGKLTNGIASLTVLDGKTGQVIFANQSTLGLPTASTLKVITSITALDILGPNYTYKTKLAYAGTIDSLGVLQGDLIISGSGDPTLGSDRYANTKGETIINKWINKIKQAGITQIHGRILADDLAYNGNDVPAGWSWSDIGNYYGAGISGLNWRENKAGLTFIPSSPGQPARLDSSKQVIPAVKFINEVTTGANGSGDNVYAFAAPYSELIYLRGTYGRDLRKTIEVSLPDPALALAHELTNALLAQNITVDSTITTGKRLANEGIALPKAQTELDVHTSPVLKDIIYWFHQKSINLYGEALLKSFGLLSGNKADTQQAARLLAKYWEQKLKIPVGELHIQDGCGLSPQNRVTTLALAKIMHYAQSRPWFADFNKSLPTINGMTMKSGTIAGVLGYTGYHTRTDGTKLTFSLLVNNYNGSSTAMRQDMFNLLDNLK